MPGEMHFNHADLIDALRISDAEWQECVNEMDRKALAESVCDDKRVEPRLAYRNINKIIVATRNIDGQEKVYQVRAYDLSASGLGFLHGAYIYEGTTAEIYMQHKTDGLTRINATIVTCSHVKKRIHRVGAKFEEPIDLQDYLLSDAA